MQKSKAGLVQNAVEAPETVTTTPTKVLRSGKRLAATPGPITVKTATKRAPARSTNKGPYGADTSTVKVLPCRIQDRNRLHRLKLGV